MNDDLHAEPGDAPTPAEPASNELTDPGETDEREPVDLEAIESDLAGVETALERLDAGTYWTDEVTGEPIPDEVLADDPVTRRSTNGT